MWPFRRRVRTTGIQAQVTLGDGHAIVDVRGQTCPGYLLAINKAVASLAPGTVARLLITYPPCGDDVAAWAKERDVDYLGIAPENGMWVIEIRKN